MRKVMLTLFAFLTISFLTSCSSDTESVDSTNAPIADATAKSYNHSTFELELLDLINEYRVSKGLNALTVIEHISYVCAGHDDYMIEMNAVNHDNFNERTINMQYVLGAVRVGENVAYGYSTPQSVLNAWIESDGHRANLEGNYTHFGIAVKDNLEGRKYYTNLFIKK